MPGLDDIVDDIDDAVDDIDDATGQRQSLGDRARDTYDRVQDTRDKVQDARDRFGKLKDKIGKGKEAGKEAGKQGGKEAGKEAGKQGGKELGKQGAKEAGKEVGKQAAKEAGKQIAKEGAKAGLEAAAEASNAAAPGVGVAIHAGIEALDKADQAVEKVTGVKPSKLLSRTIPILVGACILAPILLLMGASMWLANGAGNNTTAPSTASGNAIVAAAEKWIGTDYLWGGGSLDGPTSGCGHGFCGTGFDCSGLTRYAVYNGTGRGKELPRTADDQCHSSMVTKITSKDQLQPGDLVCFGGSHIHHIGVYKGADKFIHAPQTFDQVKISNLSSRGDFAWGVRIKP